MSDEAIPEDIMKEAEKALQAFWDRNNQVRNSRRLAEFIARAIQAERTRCAEICRRMDRDPETADEFAAAVLKVPD